MDIFYEFTSNAERDSALYDAAYEMAEAKYNRDMAIIEANHEYKLKCAEYKCLTENGSYDDYVHMVMLATEDANEEKAEAKKGLLDAIKSFFARIAAAIKLIFTGKVTVKGPVENAPDVDGISKKAGPILDKFDTAWKSFIGKVTGNNQPLADNEVDQIIQGASSLVAGIVVDFTKSIAVDALKTKTKGITDRLTEMKSKVFGWMETTMQEIQDKKDKGEDITVKEKILSQGIKIFNVFKKPLDGVKDAISKVGDFFKGLADKVKNKGKKPDDKNDDPSEEPQDNDSQDGTPDKTPEKTSSDGSKGNEAETDDNKNKDTSTETPATQGSGTNKTNDNKDKKDSQDGTPDKTPEKTSSDGSKGNEAETDDNKDKKDKTENESTSYSDFDVDELFAEFGL